ncbi:DUF362 domain-containing protein [Caldisericum sp.]|uniref:DUF362 domain-containing protein n=2 Tax=Caldisericum TaxID=693074 RepID=UPI003D0A9C8B
MRYVLRGSGFHRRRQGRGLGRGLGLGRGMGYGRIAFLNEPGIHNEKPFETNQDNLKNLNTTFTETYSKKAYVNEARCIGCGICENACGFHAIKVQNGVAKVDIEKCTGCGDCVRVCPRGAISLQENR